MELTANLMSVAVDPGAWARERGGSPRSSGRGPTITERAAAVEAITSMVYRYCELFDAGDFDAFARQFEHGVWHKADPGASGVRRWIDEHVLTYDGLPMTKHVTTNLVVDVAGDEATARSYITVLQGLPDFPLQPILAGRYSDRFRFLDGEWRWLERRVVDGLRGDTSHHTR